MPQHFDNEKIYDVETLEVCFLHCEVKSITDALHVFASWYDETCKTLVLSSCELVNVCQALPKQPHMLNKT